MNLDAVNLSPHQAEKINFKIDTPDRKLDKIDFMRSAGIAIADSPALIGQTLLLDLVEFGTVVYL